jgi:hypothetical protein
MSQARRAVGLQHFDGDRTRRARARDCELRAARRAVGRGVLPAVEAEDDAQGVAA